jgi:transcription elongation factor Elf1
MNDWHPAVECPECNSKDTRFVEPHEEMSIYECNICGCRFEIEED